MAPYSKRTFATTLAAVAALLLLPECAQSSPIRNTRDSVTDVATVSLLPSGSDTTLQGNPAPVGTESTPSLLTPANPSADPSVATTSSQLTLTDLQDPAAFSVTGTYEHPLDLTITAYTSSDSRPATIVVNDNAWAANYANNCDEAYFKYTADQTPGSATTYTSNTTPSTTVGPVTSKNDCPGDSGVFFDRRTFVSFKILWPSGHYFAGMAVNPSIGKPFFRYSCDNSQPMVEQSLAENDYQASQILCGYYGLNFHRDVDDPTTGHKRMTMNFQVLGGR